MTDLHLTYVTDDDWAALYINGVDRGPQQNHSLHLGDVLEALIGGRVVSVDHLEVDSNDGNADWLGGRGFPEFLSDIPKEARIPCKS